MPEVPLLESRFVDFGAKPKYTVMLLDAGIPPAMFSQAVRVPLLLLSIHAGITEPLLEKNSKFAETPLYDM
jgi:hypothetical protein